MSKCETCVFAKWEKDEFFGFWYVSGCEKGVKQKDKCATGKEIDYGHLEDVHQRAQERQDAWKETL